MKFPKTAASVFALLIGSVTAAAAFPATSTTSLNVRSGPGTNYRVVDVLQPGETVEVTSQSGGWYQLANGGWASGNYLDAGGETAVIIDRDYDYGPVAFYYDDYPYYWDNAGFYFFIRDGHRHRVGHDWWRRHRHDVRWHHRWHRRDRDWDGHREARRDHDRGDRIERRGDDDGRRARIERRGDNDGLRAQRREFRELREGRASFDRNDGPRRIDRGDGGRRGGGEFRGRGGGGGERWIPQGGRGGGGDR